MIMKNFKNFLSFGKLFILLAIFLTLNSYIFIESRKAKSHLYQEEDFPELSDEEIGRAKSAYKTEEDIDQKGFLEPVVNPEKFDLNFDEKLSKAEIKKAIIWMIYAKDPKNKKKMKNILTEHVSNLVEVFVNSQNFEHLNYRQFGKLMNRVNADDFINEEVMINRHWTDGGEHRDPAVDL